jgi:hypothetical protein
MGSILSFIIFLIFLGKYSDSVKRPESTCNVFFSEENNENCSYGYHSSNYDEKA